MTSFLLVGHTLYTLHDEEDLLIRYGYSQRVLNGVGVQPLDEEMAPFMEGLLLVSDR